MILLLQNLPLSEAENAACGAYFSWALLRF
jgi:hypothetical protein